MSSNILSTDFSAKEPSLGYIYQIRYSLYLLLKEKNMIAPSIQIEDLDDIVITDIDKKNLYQTKLHHKPMKQLSDKSTDFWKTIRIWSDEIYSHKVKPENTIFTIITTATVNSSSFLSQFKINSATDRKDALKSMCDISATKGSKTNQKGYDAFQRLSEVQKLKLVENIHIIDSSLSMEDTLEAIKKELHYAAPAGKIESFVKRIEGWWLQQCILLLDNKKETINGKELELEISDTRDLYSNENLPDDFPNPLEIDEEEIQSYEDRVFVKQLKLIAVKNNSLRNAISDFRRAYQQRSKWLRENLVGIEEYTRFESNLYDHWCTIFGLMKDECEDLSEAELEKIGYNFYMTNYVREIPRFKIRNNFQSEYLTRGSCHMLADDKRIGWHPNFKDKLK